MKRKTHDLRVGDVVVRKDRKEGHFVVCGTKGWSNSAFKKEDGTWDSWISVCKKMGEIPLATHASEYKRAVARENVCGLYQDEWWKIFPRGEK